MNGVPPVPPRRASFLRTIGTLIALALLIYLLSRQGWEEISTAIRGIPAWRLVLAMALMVISRLAVTGRWFILLRSCGVRISLAQALRITFAGLFANNFLPTTIGGDVVRLAGAVQLKFDGAVCAASLIADRLIGMIGMAMAVPFGLPRFLEARASFNVLIDEHTYVITGLNSLPLGRWWKAGWDKLQKISARLFGTLALWLKRPRSLFISLGITWVHMLCLFSFIYVLFPGMAEDVSFSMIAGLYSMVYLVTLLPISINGYGLQEISMTFVFTRLGGASLTSSLAVALLFRTMMMLASLPGAFFIPGMLSGSRTRNEGE